MTNCPKFISCNCPKCPLDPDRKDRVELKKDERCPYTTTQIAKFVDICESPKKGQIRGCS